MKVELAELNPSGARRFMDTLVIENLEFSYYLVAEIAYALVASEQINPEELAPWAREIIAHAQKPCPPDCKACPLSNPALRECMEECSAFDDIFNIPAVASVAQKPE